MRFKLRPYDLLVPVLVLLLILSFFLPQHNPLEIYLWSSYYRVTLRTICLISVIFMGFFWLLYKLTTPFLLSTRLTWFHILITIAIALFLVIAPLINESIFSPPTEPMVQLNHPRFFASRKIANPLAILFVIFCLSQFIYLANLSAGLLKKFF